MSLVTASLFLLSIQSGQIPAYSDSATAALIGHARERHDYQDRLVRDYSATVRTRIDVAFGRSRFARALPFAAHETAAKITWALPNDLKVDIIGQRAASTFGGDMDAAFDRPWFIPRSLGDSIRLVDDDLPSTAALHPLAPGAEEFYRYAIIDSLTIEVPGRTVHAINVRVEPKELSTSLIAGDLWLDAETVEVVRFSFVFVGEYLWETPDGGTAEDSAETREENKWASRIIKLEADLEYALFDSDYWMPYRQLVRLTVDFPWFVNFALPVRFITTFDDYEINQGSLPIFAAPPPPPPDPDEEAEVDPDTTGGISVNVGDDPRRGRRSGFRCGDGQRRCARDEAGYYRVGDTERLGRWEVYYPPADSIRDFEWPDKMELALDSETEQRIHDAVAALGKLQEQLPGDWVGRMRAGPAFESFSDIYRFNRVQGSSVGGGYQIDPGVDFSSVIGNVRFGLGDHRLTGGVTWRRDAPDGRLDVSVFRAVREAEPWTRGQGFANSMNALFTAHDDADYFLANGVSVRYQSNGAGFWSGLDARLGFERHRSMIGFARSGLADFFGPGVFQPNAPVAEGDYVAASATRSSRVGPAGFTQGVETYVGVSSGSMRAARGWASVAVPFTVAGGVHRFATRASTMVGGDMPQLFTRVGGPQTVRGFPYGFRWGRSAWSAQVDLALRSESAQTPILFIDAGDAYGAETFFPPAGLFGADSGPMTAVGVGWSLLRGLIRFNLAYGVRPDTRWRFDLHFASPR